MQAHVAVFATCSFSCTAVLCSMSQISYALLGAQLIGTAAGLAQT
jgi:hypothetical protein